MNKTLPIRGFLMHISHYDPAWCKIKEQEKPFSLNTAKKVVDALACVGMNVLIVDCEDGIEYSSHPELKRHYTVSMDILRAVVSYAETKNIEVIPKLNFSQSRFHKHNHWMYPYNENVDNVDLFENEKYWAIGFELIDELISICRPKRFFHVGMDEDNERSHRQFADAIIELHAGLSKRKLRTVIWRDSRQDPRGEVYTEKHDAADDKIPKDIVQIIWQYIGVTSEAKLISAIKKGFELWGAPGQDEHDIICWKDTLLRLGGTGMIMSRWIKCIEENEDELVKLILNKGKLYTL